MNHYKFIFLLISITPTLIYCRNPFSYAGAYAASRQQARSSSENINKKNEHTAWHEVQTLSTTTGMVSIVHDDQGNMRTLHLEEKSPST